MRLFNTPQEANVIDVAQHSRSGSSIKELVNQLFETVDIQVNGDRPWDIQIHNEDLYQRIMAQGSLGIGEAYMDGWWDCEGLDEAVSRLLRAELEGRFKFILEFSFPLFFSTLNSILLNKQRKSKAFVVGERHYDIGNELYQKMLDKRMVYTCAHWENAGNLDEAQQDKLDRACRKLHLKPGMHILDIGCGWGSFAKYAAQHYGVRVTGITVSRKQAQLANELCRGLPIDIQLKDYREVSGAYDRIASLGMFEHVGCKNYSAYMQVAHRCLKNDGLFLLHTIGSNKSTASFDPWMEKYIFPNAVIPSIKQIGRAYEGLFVMEDWQNISADYDKTLMAWFRNFDLHWSFLEPFYSDRFYRMWRYYLLSCAGLFRSRRQQLWQIIFSKHGVLNGYQRI